MNMLAPVQERRRPEPNIIAERQVLGGLFFSNESYFEIDGFLRPEHFSDPLHQYLFEQCGKRISDGTGVSPVTLAPAIAGMEAFDQFEAVNGMSYLSALVDSSVSVRLIPQYARAIVERHRRISLWEAGDAISWIASDEDEEIEEVIARAEAHLAEVADDSRGSENVQSLSDAIKVAISDATEAAQTGDGIVGVRTGLERLDRLTGGWRDGHLIIVGARPGMGKSAFMVSAAIEGARRSGEGAGIGIISLEMSNSELASRALSQQMYGHGVQLSYDDFSKGLYTGAQMGAIADAQKALDELPLHIEDAGNKTVPQIRSLARSIDRKFKEQGRRLTCLYVDYLQQIEPDRASRENQTAQVTQISKGLKAMAKQLKIPVIVLCQLNRQVENRDNKRPMLSDLRDSGSIEQDADVVIFLVRPSYYLERDKPYQDDAKYSGWLADFETEKNVLKLNVAKNRHGPRTDIRLHTLIEYNVILDDRPVDAQDRFDLGRDVL